MLIFFFKGRVSLHSSAWLGTHYVAQAGLKLKAILLLQFPECWDYGVSYHTNFVYLSSTSLGRKHCVTAAQFIQGCVVIGMHCHQPVPVTDGCSLQRGRWSWTRRHGHSVNIWWPELITLFDLCGIGAWTSEEPYESSGLGLDASARLGE